MENVKLSMKVSFELDSASGDIVGMYGSPVGDVNIVDLYNVLRCLRLAVCGGVDRVFGVNDVVCDSIDVTIVPANIEETEFCLNDYDEVGLVTNMVKRHNLRVGDKLRLVLVKE